jgi:hypothetical protein
MKNRKNKIKYTLIALAILMMFFLLSGKIAFARTWTSSGCTEAGGSCMGFMSCPNGYESLGGCNFSQCCKKIITDTSGENPLAGTSVDEVMKNQPPSSATANTLATGSGATNSSTPTSGATGNTGTGGPYTNQEKIPGAQPTSDFVAYLKQILNFGFAVIGILALFMLIIGAYQYLMAAGSGNAADAKDTITSALLGLILGLCAYVILAKINPDLVNLRAITQISGGISVIGGNLVSGTTGTYGSIKPPANMEEALKRYDSLITQAADKYGVDRNIARAMMWVESTGNPNALSSAGAGGLFQIMPKEWIQLTGTDPSQRNNIALNIDAGIKYIGQIQNGESKGNITDALGRYNGGPNWQNKSESRVYVPNVIGLANGLKQQGYN